MINTIIFDMDGLMIDSEPYHLQAFNSVLANFDIKISKKVAVKYIGLSDKDTCKDLISRYKLPISLTGLMNKKNNAYQNILQDKVYPQPGLLNLLKKLKTENYKMAIASSSHLKEIKTVVKKLNINKYFSQLVSSDQITRGKPRPDIYLLTAKRLSVTPKRCLVLEDAPNGIKSAKAAKMFCYAVPSRETKKENFSLADRKINSLSKVYEFIKKDFVEK